MLNNDAFEQWVQAICLRPNHSYVDLIDFNGYEMNRFLIDIETKKQKKQQKKLKIIKDNINHGQIEIKMNINDLCYYFYEYNAIFKIGAR